MTTSSTPPSTAPRLVTRVERAPRTPAQWLVLAYLAGDNDLSEALGEDLVEMERVGSRTGSKVAGV